MIGDNFDGVGMVTAIAVQRAFDTTTRALGVGAGGVERAIAVALARTGIGYLAITNRTRDKADDLAHTVRRAAPTCEVEAGTAFDLAAFDIIINATSLGLHGQGPIPVDVARASGTTLVADIVMVPEITPLLQAARERGLDIVRGREMLLHQIEGLADFFGITSNVMQAASA